MTFSIFVSPAIMSNQWQVFCISQQIIKASDFCICSDAWLSGPGRFVHVLLSYNQEFKQICQSDVFIL